MQASTPEYSAKATQKALFEARQTALKGQIQQLKQRITRYKDEDRGLTSEIAFTKTELSQLSAELDKTRRLLARSLVPRSRVTELERQHIRLSNQDAQLRNRRNLIASSITEAQIEINQLHKARQEEVLTQLSEARRRADAFNEALKTADKRAEHIIIKAPMEGYIHKFGPNTLGGIIAPGQEIMQIIPKREKLLLSAQILPSDIDQVSYGQKTKVIFSALNLDAPPELSGTVSFISPDSLIDETHGGTYYLVDIEIAPSELSKLKGESLKPGMPADIYIQTQTRSVMQYLLAPLRKTLRSSMKDG